MRQFGLLVVVLGVLGVSGTGLAGTLNSNDAPAAAWRVGYRLKTFSSAKFSEQNVNLKGSFARGVQWYGWSFFGGKISDSVKNIHVNSDGSIDLRNTFIASAARIPGSPYFTGTAFGGGGYFEAELKFDPALAAGRSHWPSWWGMSIEHLSEMPAPFGRWKGKSSEFEHFGEMDFFEYNNSVGRAPNQYGGTLHDWYGEYGRSCLAFCVISTSYRDSTITVPEGTDWKKYHRVGALWVPATKDARGYITFYFDGLPMKSFSWERFSADEAPPVVPSLARSTTHSVNDVLHMAIILGGAEGAPMTVKSVNVWQASDKLNWRP